MAQGRQSGHLSFHGECRRVSGRGQDAKKTTPMTGVSADQSARETQLNRGGSGLPVLPSQ
jgi:hypothetical protein